MIRIILTPSKNKIKKKTTRAGLSVDFVIAAHIETFHNQVKMVRNTRSLILYLTEKKK